MAEIISRSTVGLINRGASSPLHYAEAARQAGGEKRLLEHAGKALDALVNVNFDKGGEGSRQAAGSRPVLMAPPVRQEKEQDAAARFVELMATLAEMLGDISLNALESRLAMMKKMAESVRKQHESLYAGYEAALADLEAALADAAGTESALEAAQTRLARAKQSLAAAQARLDGLKPGDDGYEQALAARDAAQTELTDAEQGFAAAKSAHESALSAAQAANVKSDQALKALDDALVKGQGSLDPQRQQNLNAASQLVLLMARFSELLGDAAEDRLAAERAAAVEIRDAQAAVAKKNAQEYEEQIHKAEALNKAMGCLGKILGAVLTVISVVGAVFTGGASLAIAAVGIALTAGDMIGKAITGESFMEKALQPLMEHVLSPLIAEIGKALSSALESFGVDADKAALIGNIAGAIAGALLMVAAIVVVAVVGKAAASRLAPKLGEMIGNAAGKIVPDLLKNGSRSASRMFSQMATKLRSAAGLKSDAASLANYGARTQQAMVVTETAGVSAQSTMGVISAGHQNKAAQNHAGLVIASSIMDSMSIWLHDQVQAYSDALNKQFRLVEQVTNEMQRSIGVSASIARNV